MLFRTASGSLACRLQPAPALLMQVSQSAGALGNIVGGNLPPCLQGLAEALLDCGAVGAAMRLLVGA